MVVFGLGGEEDECGRPKTGMARWPTIDGNKKLRGEPGLGKYKPQETREQDGEQEDDMANPMRASGWLDVARRRWATLRNGLATPAMMWE